MTPFAEEIRAAAQALLEQQAITDGSPYRLVRETWGWPLDTVDYPALSVFLPKEAMTPVGDANAGIPNFNNECTLIIVVSLGFERPEDLKGQLVARGGTILTTLLQTPAFLQLFESVLRIENEMVLSKEGETFLAEVQIKFTVRFKTDWPPDVTGDIAEIAVWKTRPGQPAPTDPTFSIPASQEETQ